MRAYAQILRIPGGAPASAAAFVARLPLSMSALGIVLLVSDRTGSYGIAGTVAAFYIAAAAVSGPLQGRLSDRIGQRIVLIAAAVLLTGGIAAFTSVVEAEAGMVAACATAALAGLGAPQAGSFIRARWSHLLRERPRELQTAFAFEAVVDEVVFITGPILVAAIATTVDPLAGLYTAAVLSLAGSLSLAALASTEPPRIGSDAGPRRPLDPVFIVTIVTVSVALGVLFGAAEVIVVAFTDARDARHLTGVILAAWAFGSLLAGLLIGMRPPPRSQLRRLQVAITLLGLTFVPMLFIEAIAPLMIVMFIGGTMIAPSLIATMSLVESHAPKGRLTEAIAWAATGVAGGVAPGAALAGQIIDEWGASAAFGVPLTAGVLGGLVAVVALPRASRRALVRRDVSVGSPGPLPPDRR